MRISCPHCGERDVREFSYLGDASVKRPDPRADEAIFAFVNYVYLRDNPAGAHREYWYHTAGCQCWFIATRDTNTHEIIGTEPLDSMQT